MFDKRRQGLPAKMMQYESFFPRHGLHRLYLSFAPLLTTCRQCLMRVSCQALREIDNVGIVNERFRLP